MDSNPSRIAPAADGVGECGWHAEQFHGSAEVYPPEFALSNGGMRGFSLLAAFPLVEGAGRIASAEMIRFFFWPCLPRCIRYDIKAADPTLFPPGTELRDRILSVSPNRIVGYSEK